MKDLENLKNWTYLLSPFYEKTLSRQGKDDLGFLAKRLKSQFSNIFDVYSREKFAVSNTGAFEFEKYYSPTVRQKYE